MWAGRGRGGGGERGNSPADSDAVTAGTVYAGVIVKMAEQCVVICS